MSKIADRFSRPGLAKNRFTPVPKTTGVKRPAWLVHLVEKDSLTMEQAKALCAAKLGAVAIVPCEKDRLNAYRSIEDKQVRDAALLAIVKAAPYAFALPDGKKEAGDVKMIVRSMMVFPDGLICLEA